MHFSFQNRSNAIYKNKIIPGITNYVFVYFEGSRLKLVSLSSIAMFKYLVVCYDFAKCMCIQEVETENVFYVRNSNSRLYRNVFTRAYISTSIYNIIHIELSIKNIISEEFSEI